jgi:hypothetical protein
MPSVSEKQHNAMEAAAHGHSNLGIPKEVGEEFVRADAEGAGKRELGDDITDFEAAEMIRDGKLPSPTKYGEFYLFDLRITGTGAAWRDKIEEWGIRPPDDWTSPEFVERCNGLAVIFEHPPSSGLNQEEWRERAIGTVVLPYVKDSEVWGIAKIFDADAATLMQTTHRSTSPGVMPPKGSKPVELKDGTQVLAEGLPLVLDHLAVCEVGVWDKDGPPAGVRLDASDRKDTAVPEKSVEELEQERDDAKKRFDAAESELAMRRDKHRKDDDDKSRKDDDDDDKKKNDAKKHDAKKHDESDKEALEKSEKEGLEENAEDKHDDKKHDDKKHDDKKHDDDEKRRRDGASVDVVNPERGSEGHEKSGVTHFDSAKRIESLELTTRQQAAEIERLSRASKPLTMEERDQIAAAFMRADKVYQMLGESTPQNIPGETPIAYRRRLANGVRQYTTSFKNYAFHDSQQATDFALVEKAIYDEATEYAKNPPDDQSTGRLREIVTHPNGKTRSEFIGDSRIAWLPFMPATRQLVRGFNKDPHRAATR